MGGRLRSRHRAPGHGQGHGRQEVRQQGLRDLPRFPRALSAQGPRRRVDRRARPLARHPVHRGPAGRIRRLRREAPDPQPARGPGPLRRGQALRPGLADGVVAAVGRELPPGRGARSQRTDRQDQEDRGRPSLGALRLRRDLRPGGAGRAAAEPRLRVLGRAGPLVALLQGPRPHELALEHGLRRRPVHGLDRPSPRHRPLGHGLGRDRPGRDRGHGRIPDLGHLQQPDPLLRPGQVRRRDAHGPGRRPRRDLERHEVDRRIRLDLGRPRPVRDRTGQPQTRGHRPRRRSACTRAATTTRTSSTASAAGGRPSRRPRRPTARPASATSASSPWRSAGRSSGTRPTETIIGDPEAERLLGHSYRKPWQLPE